MNTDSIAIKCSIVRGGTSKAIFVMDNELPSDAKLREKVILGMYLLLLGLLHLDM